MRYSQVPSPTGGAGLELCPLLWSSVCPSEVPALKPPAHCDSVRGGGLRGRTRSRGRGPHEWRWCSFRRAQGALGPSTTRGRSGETRNQGAALTGPRICRQDDPRHAASSSMGGKRLLLTSPQSGVSRYRQRCGGHQREAGCGGRRGQRGHIHADGRAALVSTRRSARMRLREDRTPEPYVTLLPSVAPTSRLK